MIRKAGIADVEALVPLIKRHGAYEKAEVHCVAATLAAAFQQSDNPLHCWIAWNQTGPLGYAAATVDFSTWRGSSYLHLDCLFIDEGHRGLGIGTLLFNSVREFGRELGLNHLEWQTPAWNSRAISFYERLGAVGVQKTRFAIPLG